MNRLLASLLVSLCLAVGAAAENPAAPATARPEPVAALPDGLYAEISTPRGVITCELFFAQAPLTVANSVGLAEGTLGPAPRKPFYNGLKFHRVVPGFVAQGGDPAGTGEGGPGYVFPDEFARGLRHDAAGALAMANAGPDTNGSQFYLTLRDTNRLNYLYSVFGRTVRGLEVLPQLRQGDAMTVKILRRGAAATAFRADEPAFAALLTAAQKTAAARAAETATHFSDAEKLLPAEPAYVKIFDYKLANLERASGLKIVAQLRAKSPSAADDAKPGAFMHALATQLGTAGRGALAVYFADENEWRVWIGDGLTARFVGQPGTAEEHTASGAMHTAKEAFLQAAEAAADAAFAERKKTVTADAPLPPGLRLKQGIDSLLDGLILKLEPTP